jgi:hypothetical protein
MTRAEIIAISNAAADAAGIPRVLLLAAAIAESNLNPDARRPKSPSDDQRFWPDVSFGAWQQTVRWSAEYIKQASKNGTNPAAFPGAGTIAIVGALYLDPEYAAEVAAAQLKPKYRPAEEDAVFKALCRYNWPAGGGAPKGDAQAQNYRRGIVEAERILEVPVQPSTIVYEDYRDPAPAGAFSSTPRGIVLHGSRSGKAGNPQMAEYTGTANWEVNNPNSLGWNITVADHRVAEHIDVRHWGWHAKAASPHYLSVEFAQPTVNDAITDAQVDALADWIKTRVTPVWGDLGFHFPSHAEVQQSGEAGDRGNTDVYPLGDPRLDTLRNRLYALLGAPGWGPVPEPPPMPPLPPKPTLEEVRAALIEITTPSDDQIVGRVLREQIAALLERMR